MDADSFADEKTVKYYYKVMVERVGRVVVAALLDIRHNKWAAAAVVLQ